ncbi:hypothetical protein D3C71_437560 [compost metagenome]
MSVRESFQHITHVHGQPPLGRLESENGRPVWRGPARWMIEHGKARSYWLVGKIDSVENVLLPDGSRTSNVRRGAPETGLWRFEDEDQVWTYGSLHVTADDITFVIEQQPQPPRWATGSLGYQLCASSNACDLVEDLSMADEVYAALGSGLWKMVGSGKEYVGPWRRAAEIVAAMRGRNEPYTDFFNSGSEGHVFPDAKDLLQGMGWTFEGALQDVDTRNMTALKILEICEQKPAGEMPDWAVEWYSAFSPEEDHPRARMINAVFTGRATPSDLDRFWEHYDLDGEDA